MAHSNGSSFDHYIILHHHPSDSTHSPTAPRVVITLLLHTRHSHISNFTLLPPPCRHHHANFITSRRAQAQAYSANPRKEEASIDFVDLTMLQFIRVQAHGREALKHKCQRVDKHW